MHQASTESGRKLFLRFLFLSCLAGDLFLLTSLQKIGGVFFTCANSYEDVKGEMSVMRNVLGNGILYKQFAYYEKHTWGWR